jgi:hypothetical protein
MRRKENVIRKVEVMKIETLETRVLSAAHYSLEQHIVSIVKEERNLNN